MALYTARTPCKSLLILWWWWTVVWGNGGRRFSRVTMKKTSGSTKDRFLALAKKFEKIFRPSTASESDDAPQVHAAVSNLQLPAAHKKEVEKAVREQLRRQKEAEIEKKRQEYLELSTANIPWKPKARPGDEMYPCVRTKSQKSKSSSSATAQSSSSTDQSSDGLEPPPIDMEEFGMNSIRSSSLRLLLEDMAKDVEPGRSSTKKPFQSLTPLELVEMSHKDETGWRRYMRENTIMAVATAMPTDDDRKKANDGTKRSETCQKKVRFIETVVMILAPTGQPYAPDESNKKETVPLEVDRWKKR